MLKTSSVSVPISSNRSAVESEDARRADAGVDPLDGEPADVEGGEIVAAGAKAEDIGPAAQVGGDVDGRVVRVDEPGDVEGVVAVAEEYDHGVDGVEREALAGRRPAVEGVVNDQRVGEAVASQRDIIVPDEAADVENARRGIKCGELLPGAVDGVLPDVAVVALTGN